MLQLANWLFLGAVLVYLIFKLKEFGFSEIVASLPRTPWFYFYFALLYVSLPLTEVFIYRMCWGLPVRGSIGAFFKKRVYNKDVMGYSGEVYFFAWAQDRLSLTRTRIVETIRDTNIISSIASTCVAVVLMAVFLVRGEINLRELVGNNTGYVFAAIAVFFVLITIAIRFRRYVFSMQRRLALNIFLIYAVRLIVAQVFQIAQWVVVLPDEPLGAWFTLAAIAIIVSRIPLISNQNIVFLGAGLSVAEQLGLPSLEIAAMLIATAVLDKIVNLIVFGIATYSERHKIGETLSLDDLPS